MSTPLRILHVETGMNLYGGALQVLYLLKGLSRHPGVETILVCPEGSAIAEAARGHVPKVLTLPVKGDLDLGFLRKLARILRREKPHILHLHSRRGADVLGGIAGRVTGTTTVLTRRVDNPENRTWVRLKYRLYDRVVTISEGIRQVLLREGVPPGKITCVRSAVDAGLYSQPCDCGWFRNEFGLDEGVLACGTIAQFIDRKGHADLLEAIPGILEVVPEARFLLFGKGPMEDILREQCRDLGIVEKVLFAGFREDLPRILGCLDLVIHPARMEGLGVALLQAAAAGVPVLGARAGGIPEIVHDGVNGYLVPPGDPFAITEAALKILTDRNRLRQMGEKGREVVRESFSIEAMVNGNLDLYMELSGKLA